MVPGAGSSAAPPEAEIAKRHYINTEQIAGRLKDQFGAPEEFDGATALDSIKERKGIVFLRHAYENPSRLGLRTGSHVDVWDGANGASGSRLPFNNAEKVWFWELSD
jgi:hypothetical protein